MIPLRAVPPLILQLPNESTDSTCGGAMIEHRDDMGLENQKPIYQKPAIEWEEILEVRRTLAATCGKIEGQSAQCNSFPGI